MLGIQVQDGLNGQFILCLRHFLRDIMAHIGAGQEGDLPGMILHCLGDGGSHILADSELVTVKADGDEVKVLPEVLKEG